MPVVIDRLIYARIHMSSSNLRTPANRPNVLIAGPLPPDLLARLDAGYETYKLWQENDRSAFLAQHGSRFDVLATSGVFGADAALMKQLPNLRLIASFGVGTDPIDLEEASGRRGHGDQHTRGTQRVLCRRRAWPSPRSGTTYRQCGSVRTSG
ncbi:Rossmann-fold NAD(P)-binding domain-containing protein [Paraburkholderia sediminicola]|uniref:hypothetical protein n=1 Tax=Paraburkholderia sediminicola TaxID=458836 RepID=UPI0038BD6E05